MAPGRKRSLFPLRPRLIPPRRLLLAATAAAASAFTFLFLVIVLLSTSPSSPPSSHHVASRSSSSPPPPLHHCGAASLGELGNALVSMLPKGLPFTVFAPSADAFRRVLNLRPNGSAAHATDDKQTAAGDGDDTYAVLSRVLGFCAVPRRLLAADVAPRGGGSARVVLDSVSGLRIHVVARDDAGGAPTLVANGVRSECVDVVRGETVVHVMAGVLMDAEFERSFAAGFDFGS